MRSSVCYILPSYSQDEAQHFAHVPRLLSEIGKHADVYVIIEKCRGNPVIANVKAIYPQKYGYGNRFLRMLELAAIAFKLRRRGCRKFFIRISATAGFTLCLLSKLADIETYYWSSGQGKNILPGWNSGFRNFFQRLQTEIHLIPFYFISKLTDYFVTGPEKMGDYYIQEYGVNPRKIVILYNDIDVTRFKTLRIETTKESLRKELNLPMNKKIVLFVGRVSPLKGGPYLIPIAEEVLRKVDNVIFVVVGSVQLNIFKQKVKSKGLDKVLRLVGSVPNSVASKYYLAADVFIMPSNSEGFPRVLLETMASGLPFVAFDVGGVRDIVNERQLDFVVPRGNVKLFAEKLIRLLKDANLRGELADDGLKRVQYFSTGRVAKMFLERIVLS